MLVRRIRLGPKERTEVLIVVGETRIFLSRGNTSSEILVGIDAPRAIPIQTDQPFPSAPLPEPEHVEDAPVTELLRSNRAVLSLRPAREAGAA